MALAVLTLQEMHAWSTLAEVQALDAARLERFEREALPLLQNHLGRRLTVDAQDSAVVVEGDGLNMITLPEHLTSFTSAVMSSGLEITDQLELALEGWVLRRKAIFAGSPFSQMFADDYRQFGYLGGITITGKWGTACPQAAKDVLMDIVEALAVRRGDATTHRDEIMPWGNVSDGGLSANRDTADRHETLENLLRYDLQTRLAGCYRPTIIRRV